MLNIKDISILMFIQEIQDKSFGYRISKEDSNEMIYEDNTVMYVIKTT